MGLQWAQLSPSRGTVWGLDWRLDPPSHTGWEL